MTYDLAIDLGTTWTAAAIRRPGGDDIAQLGNRAAVVPSVLYLAADGEVLAGEAAQRRGSTDPGRQAAEFKRRMGDPTPTLVGGTPMSADALMGRMAAWVVQRVHEREASPADRLVLTHPATWGPYKLEALVNAVRQAGVRQEPQLVAEPVAAALHYATSERIGEGAAIAVYDLGGGTFDATVLRREGDGFRVIGRPEGLERLGGIDIDEAVVGFVREALPAAFADLDPDDPTVLTALGRLRQECVAAKEALSTDADTTIPVLLPGHSGEVRLTRRELEQRVRPALADTVTAMQRALAEADVELPEKVLLVGGASRMPLVAELVAEGIGAPVAIDVHPKHAVALGALHVLPVAGAAAPTAAPTPVAAPAAAPVAAPEAPPTATPSPAPVATAAPSPSPAPAPITAAGTPPVNAPSAPAASPPVAHAPTGSAPDWSAGPSGTTAPAASSRSRVPLLAGAAVVVLGLVGGAVVLSGGGDDPAAEAVADAEADAGADAGAGAAANRCGVADGPFICIEDVSVAGGQLLASFSTVEAALVPVGQERTATDLHAQFFLAAPGTTTGRAPDGAEEWIDWGRPDPFEGFASDRWGSNTAVCAVLATPDQQVVSGSGSCAPLPR